MIWVMARSRSRLRTLPPVLVIVTVAIACNQTPEGRLPVYPVKGKVLHKGSPLVGALVVFEKSAGGATTGATAPGAPAPIRATARTGTDGSFELMTYQGNDGAPAGD